MTQFHALIINLQARHEAILPASHGNLAQAAFLGTIDATAPELARALHDHHQRKPYTLSKLHGSMQRRKGELYLPAGWEGSFRLTLLHSSLFNAFMQQLLSAPTFDLRLGSAHFNLSHIYGAPGSHPWCGYATAEQLLAAAAAEAEIRLDFHSATSFNLTAKSDSGRERVLVLPDPGRVWSSLRAKWQDFAGRPIPADFEKWVERNVVVKQMRRWETKSWRYKGKSLLGGRGDVIFKALDDDQAMRRWWNLLADFAFYAGVGRKTSLGMGQCRRLEG